MSILLLLPNKKWGGTTVSRRWLVTTWVRNRIKLITVPILSLQSVMSWSRVKFALSGHQLGQKSFFETSNFFSTEPLKNSLIMSAQETLIGAHRKINMHKHSVNYLGIKTGCISTLHRYIFNISINKLCMSSLLKLLNLKKLWELSLLLAVMISTLQIWGIYLFTSGNLSYKRK